MLLFCCCFQNLFLFFQKRFLLLCVSMNVKSLQNFHTFLNMNSQQTLKNQFIRLWDDYITLMHTWIFYSRSCGEQKCLFQMKMDTVLECPTKYVCISASGRKLIVHYEKDYSLFLSYLKPESLMFKSFTRILYFNHLKMVTG